VTTQHSEHLWSDTLDDGYPCQQSRPQVKRQDRLCRCGQILLLLGNDMVEIGDDCAEHPEAPEIVLAGYRYWNASHQEKPGDFGCRCPCADAAFGFIVEQLFATKSGTPILLERGGKFALAGIPELVSTQRASDAPSEQLASQDWRRVIRATVRAVLRWLRGENSNPKTFVIHAYRWWANLKARFEKCGLHVTRSARFPGLLPNCPHADGPREAKLFSREDGASG
jgi:hypothetical protein